MLDIEQIRKNKPIKELLNFSIINIDKPSGPTSFTVSSYLRSELRCKKTSHLGTLDPQVSGVLPIALGRACRLNDYFMHRDKEYVGIMRLHEFVEDKKLQEQIKKFIGKISQMPPVKSNVKRAVREREVKSFKILEKDEQDILFQTEVQAGTYIRKLIHDLGETLGGAHMLELRRIKAGVFTEEKLYTLYEFDKALAELKEGNEKPIREMLVPAEIIANILPKVEIKKEFLKKCLTGSPIFKSFLVKKESFEKDQKICVFEKDKLLGCYRVVNEGDVLAVPEFVFN